MKCFTCGKEEKDGVHLLGLCKFHLAPEKISPPKNVPAPKINLNICVSCKNEINPPNRRGLCNQDCFTAYFKIE